MGQIGPKWETSGLGEPKCIEIWSEKVPDLSHLELIWPTPGQNLTYLANLRKQNPSVVCIDDEILCIDDEILCKDDEILWIDDEILGR